MYDGYWTKRLYANNNFVVARTLTISIFQTAVVVFDCNSRYSEYNSVLSFLTCEWINFFFKRVNLHGKVVILFHTSHGELLLLVKSLQIGDTATWHHTMLHTTGCVVMNLQSTTNYPENLELFIHTCFIQKPAQQCYLLIWLIRNGFQFHVIKYY